MGFIDVDSHVLEVPETWDFLEPSEQHFGRRSRGSRMGRWYGWGRRATKVGLPRTPSQLYFAGDTWTRFVPSHGAMSPHVNKYDPGMLDLTDPANGSRPWMPWASISRS